MIIHRYRYKPEPKFFGIRTMHMGVELEVCCKRPKYEFTLVTDNIFSSLKERVYFKRDISIYPRGFEIVSHPMILGEHKLTWTDKFFNNNEIYVNRSTGMHVHLSRNKFTNNLLNRFIDFIFYNRRFSFYVGGRNTDYAYIPDSKCLNAARSYADSKHSAVNFCNTQGTVEVRLFKATLDKEEFFGNLEFCKSLFTYCKDPAFKSIDYKDYIEYLDKYKNKYPNIYKRVTIFDNERIMAA